MGCRIRQACGATVAKLPLYGLPKKNIVEISFEVQFRKIHEKIKLAQSIYIFFPPTSLDLDLVPQLLPTGALPRPAALAAAAFRLDDALSLVVAAAAGVTTPP